jgi:truncated hemoglobin YjbI
MAMMESVKTVFEAAGGMDGMRRLASAWHHRVMADDVVSHAFSRKRPALAVWTSV